MARILVVEDEEDISTLIRHNLENEGHQVDILADGVAALQAVRQTPPDLMLLDIMLPGMDGKEVCKAVRRDYNFPIIMISAKSTEMDKVIGLEVGADDYLAKPFGMLELVARVRSALRRSARENAEEQKLLKGGNIVLDRSKHEVKVADKLVDLRPKEFALLETFLSNKGRVLDRDTLLERVWGEDEYIDLGTIDVHIRRLRAKVEHNPDKPRHILTIRGYGYKFSEE